MGNLTDHFAGGGGGGGNVLEQLAFQCKADAMTDSFGNTITPEHVTSYQYGQTTAGTKVNGSQIDYTPPEGTTKVIYEFRMQIGWHQGTHNIGHFQVYVDNTAITDTYHTSGGYYREDEVVLTSVFDINSSNTDSNANAKFASWTSDKTIKVSGRGYSTSNYWYKWHNTQYSNGGGTDIFTGPKLIITALK
jgi:hypothetical protein